MVLFNSKTTWYNIDKRRRKYFIRDCWNNDVADYSEIQTHPEYIGFSKTEQQTLIRRFTIAAPPKFKFRRLIGYKEWMDMLNGGGNIFNAIKGFDGISKTYEVEMKNAINRK